jgi:hypothetical protein
MSQPRVMPLTETAAAGWLADEMKDFGGCAGDLVPRRFPVYVRVLHRPDQGRPDRATPPSWAELARRRGTVIHAAAQFELVAGWDAESIGVGGDPAREAQPLLGTLDPLTLPRLVDRLRPHTQTEDSCWLALWDGYGESPAAWGAYPRFALPGRSYWLFHAPLAEVDQTSVEFHVAGMEERSTEPGGLALTMLPARDTTIDDQVVWVRQTRAEGFVQSPNLWWPADHAWFVASEIDYDSTIIAGSEAMAHDLLADPDIECLVVSPDTSLRANADVVNRRPG